MAQLSVSTVIPSYNRASLVGLALCTVVPQCLPGDEVIVVDDGSTDDTERVVRSFGPPVRYLRRPHLGVGAARNAGVEAAGGDLIAFLDSDDEWMPWKLARQRAALEAMPEILFVFTDFGYVSRLGERRHGGLRAWSEVVLRPWGDILGEGMPSDTIPGVPADAPPFDLHVGRIYERCIWGAPVCTNTVMVRKEAAGEALHFPEDVPTLEEHECWARLARRGLAGYLDCETAWNRYHTGAQMIDQAVDGALWNDALLVITERVWGRDEEYLALHRDEFEAAMDGYRARKVRYLLGRGRRQEARREFARFFHGPPGSYALLSCVPGGLMGLAAAARRRYYMRQRTVDCGPKVT